MKKILVIVIGAMVMTTMGYTAESMVGTGRSLTFTEFAASPELHGISDHRIAAKKYEMYKRGLGNIPKPNLDKRHIRTRSDEMRGRY